MVLYDIVYMVGNVFMTYIIYKFMNVFYAEKKVSKNIEVAYYFIYFILITFVHIIVKIPLIIAVTNLILLLVLTFLYDPNIKKGLLSTVLIYVTLACTETLTVFVTSFVKIDILNHYEYDSIFGIILVRVICFLTVLLFSAFKSIKKGAFVPKIYWLSLVIVPFGTILLFFSSFLGNNLPEYLTIIIIIVVLLINVITFYLYDSISKFMEDKLSKRLADEQNKYYEKQLELMKKSLNSARTIRHDLKNKLSPVYELAVNGKNSELINKLAELTDFCKAENEYAKSGNIAIDSILNFKLQKVREDNIDVYCNILIPQDIKVSPFNIAVILGNLIDNALEGVYTVSENRWIDIKIKYTKGRLIITISNSFDGKIVKKNGTIITRKQDEENHGIGLKSVKETIDKYAGDMDIEYTKDKFKAKVLMYI